MKKNQLIFIIIAIGMCMYLICAVAPHILVAGPEASAPVALKAGELDRPSGPAESSPRISWEVGTRLLPSLFSVMVSSLLLV